jgi:hypothetical protein
LPRRTASEFPVESAVAYWGALELLEAAVRTGDSRVARDALDRISEKTGPAGTDWALGVESRSRALLSTSSAAEELHRRAILWGARSRCGPLTGGDL